MSTSKSKKISAADFDAAFDAGDDVSEYLDTNAIKARYPTQRISIDFPKNILQELDLVSAQIGVTRTSLIKMWVAMQLSKKSVSR